MNPNQFIRSFKTALFNIVLFAVITALPLEYLVNSIAYVFNIYTIHINFIDAFLWNVCLNIVTYFRYKQPNVIVINDCE